MTRAHLNWITLHVTKMRLWQC